MAPGGRARLAAQRLFFPAAALHAALVMPASLAVMTGLWAWPPGLVAGHGREMLFGFALALVAGYLLGPLARPRLYAIFALWLAARTGALFVPEAIIAGLADLLFVVVAAWHIVPKLTAAKKWRNRIIAPLVLALFLLPIAYAGLSQAAWIRPGSLLLFGIVLLTLLMAFMGGRILAAAAAGEIQRRGGRLDARVQPPLEAALIVVIGLAALLSLAAASMRFAGMLLVVAGVIAAVRLLRWRLWQCPRTDLVALGIGYAWLAAGMAALGAALWTDGAYGTAMHLITIGALGTLSITIAARVHLMNLKQAEDAGGFFIVTTGLIAVATLLRLLPVWLSEHTVAALRGAAASWSLAYLLLLALLLGLLTSGRRSPAQLHR